MHTSYALMLHAILLLLLLLLSPLPNWPKRNCSCKFIQFIHDLVIYSHTAQYTHMHRISGLWGSHWTHCCVKSCFVVIFDVDFPGLFISILYFINNSYKMFWKFPPRRFIKVVVKFNLFFCFSIVFYKPFEFLKPNKIICTWALTVKMIYRPHSKVCTEARNQP